KGPPRSGVVARLRARRRSRGYPGVVPASMAGDQLVGGLRSPTSRRVAVNWGRRVEQRLHHPPGLLDAVLTREALAVANHRRMQEHLVRSRAFTAFLGELHVQLDRFRRGRSGAARVDDQPDPGRGVELDDELVRLRPVALVPETEARRVLEDEPKLGLRRGELLAGADEERDSRPTPVVDVEAHRGVGLRLGVGRDPVDLAVAVVLAANVMLGI